MKSDNSKNGFYEADNSRTIDASGGNPVYSASKNSYHTCAEENITNTLVATDYKDLLAVMEEPYYIVRRLTPTECARLQGYPDYWHVLPKVKELSKEKLELLTQAYILNRHIKTNKPFDEINEPTEKSLINWYNKLDSDSAVYKAYGNSLALPCAYTVIAGISKYRK